MLSRDLVPMAEECASRAGVGKPLDLAAGRDTDARARGYAEGALAANTAVRIDLMTDGLTASP